MSDGKAGVVVPICAGLKDIIIGIILISPVSLVSLIYIQPKEE